MHGPPAKQYLPAPVPRLKPLGPLALLRVLAKNPLEAWTQAHCEQPIVMGGLSIGRVALVSDPAAIRRVLSAGLTNGLLTAEGQQWRVQRRALAPLFARRTVMSVSAAMVDAAAALVERLTLRDGEIEDVAVEVTRLTLKVLERTMFSEGLGRRTEEIRVAMKHYFEAIGRLDPFNVLGLPNVMPRLSRRKLRPMLSLFESAIDAIVSTRRRRIAEDPSGVPRDILTLLLEARDPETGAGLSEFEVRANILTLIFAGHETTANSITWTLFLLSQSPEWRSRVEAEADRELDGDIDGLSERLVETRAVIDEANRLYRPIAAISRAALAPDELAGEPIRRGTMVVIAPYVLHRHRALWADPDVFDPNRFLGGARERIDRFAYLPFGVCPRVCIDAALAMQEASIVVATVMRNFTLQLAPGHAVWPMHRVTVRPDGGLPMIVRRR